MMAESILELIAAAPRTERDPLWCHPLAPMDQPLVRPGDQVAPGDPLATRPAADKAGVMVRSMDAVAGGRIRSVDARRICIQTLGLGLPSAIALGESVRGRLIVAVPDRYSELRASSIDVSVGGAIVVAGAGVGTEALTRARTLGARGVICGGIVGKEVGRLTASEARQRASLRAPVPFAVICLNGYGARPISSPVCRQLAAAASQEVALSTDPPMVILDENVVKAAPAARGLVRVTSGTYVGREGTVLDLRGSVGSAGMGVGPAALIALSSAGAERPHERRVVNLHDLERLD